MTFKYISYFKYKGNKIQKPKVELRKEEIDSKSQAKKNEAIEALGAIGEIPQLPELPSPKMKKVKKSKRKRLRYNINRR